MNVPGVALVVVLLALLLLVGAVVLLALPYLAQLRDAFG